MRIVEIRDSTVPISSEISNAYISFSSMQVSVVAIVSDVVRDGRPFIGYGFNLNGRYAPQGILRDRMIPRLLGAKPEQLLDTQRDNLDPLKAWSLMMSNEKPGGHGERSVAVGVLDMALWDLTAKIESKPLYQLLAERYQAGRFDSDVWVYAAGGYYYPGKGVEQLVNEMKGYVDLGYETVKIKIGGASIEGDQERIEAILRAIAPACLAVDANGRFDLDEALAYAEMLQQYDLVWYEEPGNPLDFELNAAVAAASNTPIATGENLFSMQNARNLIRHGGMDSARDWLQFDPALSYGLPEYLRTLGMIEELGWSRCRCVPHGGHQFALHIAAGLGLGGNETHPGVFEPFGGFADDIAVENGRVRLPDAPGIGIETKRELATVFDDLVG